MKLEQNILQFAESGGDTGYIDLARSLSAVNAKSITQTKRRKGKHRPLGFLFRVRAMTGSISVSTLNCGYPTRNSVVLAGHARDEMLKSAGISRSNLETYQKELRIIMEDGGGLNHQYMPNASDKGTGSGGIGVTTYDYTQLTSRDPDGSASSMSKILIMLGSQNSNPDSWDDDAGFFVVDNWYKWRHSFTPAAAADDTADNVFSWVIQQGETATGIIDRLDDEADEKPYDLTDFSAAGSMPSTLVSTEVGNPTSGLIVAPLGLLKIVSSATATWEIEVVGITEL